MFKGIVQSVKERLHNLLSSQVGQFILRPAPTDISKNLTWNEVFGATDYVVEVGTTPGGVDILELAIGSTTPAYTLTGLIGGTTYYVRVRSVAANGGTGIENAGEASAEISFVA